MALNKCFNITIPFSSFFPHYLSAAESTEVSLQEKLHRISSLHPKIISRIEENLQLGFMAEIEDPGNVCMANTEEVRDDFKMSFAPIDLLDYMYAILLSQEYRRQSHQLFNAALTEVPYPEDAATFWPLVRLGGRLRRLHLPESLLMPKPATTFPKVGGNIIHQKNDQNTPVYEPTSGTSGRIRINEQQYFDRVALRVWNFHFGGHKPAREWLRERQGRKLSHEEIDHYRKIILVLGETDKLLREIDVMTRQ